MKTPKLTIILTALALVSAGCSEDDPAVPVDPCGGNTTVTGTYISTDPAITMTVSQCGANVTGNMTVGGQDFKVTGTVEEGVFNFTTNSVDLCAARGFRRAIFSQSVNPFVISGGGAELAGSLRINDSYCSTSRTLSRGFTTTFVRAD